MSRGRKQPTPRQERRNRQTQADRLEPTVELTPAQALSFLGYGWAAVYVVGSTTIVHDVYHTRAIAERTVRDLNAEAGPGMEYELARIALE